MATRKSRGKSGTSRKGKATKSTKTGTAGTAAKPARAAKAGASDELRGIELPESLVASLGLALKSEKLYYRIGEVAEITDVKPYVLRYWESEFRWMAPQKSRSKQRLYRRKDIEMILLIKRLLYAERYTIAGARQRLRELGVTRAIAEAKVAELTETRSPQELAAQVRSIREQLQAVRAELVQG